jgi:hypothetical protein
MLKRLNWQRPQSLDGTRVSSLNTASPDCPAWDSGSERIDRDKGSRTDKLAGKELYRQPFSFVRHSSIVGPKQHNRFEPGGNHILPGLPPARLKGPFSSPPYQI